MIEIRAQKVYGPSTADGSVTSVKAIGTGYARIPTVSVGGTYPAPQSEFLFTQGTGNAVSTVGGFALVPDAATSWDAPNERIKGPFTGPLGTNVVVGDWSIAFTLTINQTWSGFLGFIGRPANALDLTANSDGSLHLWKGGSGTSIQTNAGLLTPGNTYQVCYTHTGGTAATAVSKIYVNGTERASGAQGGISTAVNLGNSYLVGRIAGNVPIGPAPQAAFLDNVRAWNTTLTPTQVAAVAGTVPPPLPPPPQPPNPIPLWTDSPPAGVCPNPAGPVVGAGDVFDAAILAQNELWDNFDGPNGSNPDSRLWVEDLFNQGGQQTYEAARTFLDGSGNLVFEALRDGPGLYRSGRLSSRTKFNMQYGWLAARIKFPSDPGFFPAWWALFVGFNTNPSLYGEIDMMEFFGAATTYNSHLHFGSGNQDLPAPADVPASHGDDASLGYHTYWMLWEPDRIKIGVDDLTIVTWTAASLTNQALWSHMQQPFYYIWNFAVHPTFLPAPPAGAFPARMLTDWIWYKPLSEFSSVDNPSGVAVPTGDLPNWNNIFWDDFTQDAAVGTWDNPTDASRICYTGAQGQKWRSYPETFLDTYQHRPYQSGDVLSVSNSCLTFNLHNVNGIPAGANPSPLITGGAAFNSYTDQYQVYGRYSARLKVTNSTMSEYHAAWLLWPESNIWPTDGEEDFPEGPLSGPPGGFHHWARGPAGTNNGQDAATMPGGTSWLDWHTYTIEWMPGRVIYLVDGVQVLNSTSFCPDGRRMRWQLQTETNGSGTHVGQLLCDWVSVWAWTG